MYTKCKFSWHNRAGVSDNRYDAVHVWDSTKVGCKAASRYTATVQSSWSSLNEVWDFQQSFGKAPARPELSCQASITNWTLATYHPCPHRSPLAPGQVMHHLEDLYSHLQISQWPGYSVSARPPSPNHTTSDAEPRLCFLCLTPTSTALRMEPSVWQRLPSLLSVLCNACSLGALQRAQQWVLLKSHLFNKTFNL